MTDPGQSTGLRPSFALLTSHPAHFIALGFGTGLAPVAPGTIGTLLAFPIYAVLERWLAPAGILALLPVLFALGVWACGRTGRALDSADHSGMNWDEIVAFLLVLVFTPPSLAWQAAAFGAFRLFDIAKPPPIRLIDRKVKGGFGVMLDDLLAAFYALIVLAGAKFVLG
jgi:phosphatidylglycerophosphatase A